MTLGWTLGSLLQHIDLPQQQVLVRLSILNIHFNDTGVDTGISTAVDGPPPTTSTGETLSILNIHNNDTMIGTAISTAADGPPPTTSTGETLSILNIHNNDTGVDTGISTAADEPLPTTMTTETPFLIVIEENGEGKSPTSHLAPPAINSQETHASVNISNLILLGFLMTLVVAVVLIAQMRERETTRLNINPFINSSLPIASSTQRNNNSVPRRINLPSIPEDSIGNASDLLHEPVASSSRSRNQDFVSQRISLPLIPQDNNCDASGLIDESRDQVLREYRSPLNRENDYIWHDHIYAQVHV